MREPKSTIFRYLALLQLLPQRPKNISTSGIKKGLEKLNPEYSVDIRTIQRDLEKLSTIYPITCDTKGRANCWYWADKSAFTQIPAMGESTALTLRFAEEYLQAIMPPSSLKLLSPYFDHARGILKGTKLDIWASKVKIIHWGPELIPPKVDLPVQDVVYQGLLEGKQIKAIYQGRGKEQPREYIMNPQGLVVRDGIIYLIASLWSYGDVRHFALHRMKKAELLNEPAQKLAGFSLEKHIQEDKEFSYPVSRKKITLRVLIDNHIANHLSECRLSEDQKLKPQKDGRILLTATVADTDDLRWWLLGFGNQIEIISPNKLRAEFKEMVSLIYKKYKKLMNYQRMVSGIGKLS